MGYSDWKEAALDFKRFVGNISNPEQREKANQMREFMLEQKEEIFALKEALSQHKEKITDLEVRLKDKDALSFEEPYYATKDEHGEIIGRFCSKCFDDEKKKIRLHAGIMTGEWCCPKCKTYVKDSNCVKPRPHYTRGGTSRSF